MPPQGRHSGGWSHPVPKGPWASLTSQATRVPISPCPVPSLIPKGQERGLRSRQAITPALVLASSAIMVRPPHLLEPVSFSEKMKTIKALTFCAAVAVAPVLLACSAGPQGLPRTTSREQGGEGKQLLSGNISVANLYTRNLSEWRIRLSTMNDCSAHDKGVLSWAPETPRKVRPPHVKEEGSLKGEADPYIKPQSRCAVYL